MQIPGRACQKVPALADPRRAWMGLPGQGLQVAAEPSQESKGHAEHELTFQVRVRPAQLSSSDDIWGKLVEIRI